MALFPAYRLTLYGTNDTTPLTPVAGAIHSDTFKVASVQGVTGYMPYLGLPEGRKGRYTPHTGHLDIGALNFRLLDKRTGTSNLQRWVSAFIGDSRGQAQLTGRKVVVEECLDWNGATGTWTPFLVGRVSDVTLDEPLWYSVTVMEATEDLDLPCFVGRPHANATGAIYMQTWPVALSNNYGPISGSTSGSTIAFSGSIEKVTYMGSDFKQVTLDNASYFSGDNIIRGETLRTLINTGLGIGNGFGNGWGMVDGYRLVISSGSVSEEYKMHHVETVPIDYSFDNAFSRIKSVRYVPVTYSYMNQVTASAFPVGSQVTVAIVPEKAAITKDNPLFITDTHPAAIMRDLVKGYYGYRDTNGNPVRSLYVDDSAFNTLINDTRWGTARFAITEPTRVADFIESQLMPFGLGYRVEPRNISGSIEGVFVPFDARLPELNGIVPFDPQAPASASGLVTLTNDDIADMSAARWVSGTPLSTLTVTHYRERYTPYRAPVGDGEGANAEVRPVFEQTPLPTITVLSGKGDALSYDLQGVRVVESDNPESVATANTNALLTKERIRKHLETRFSTGAAIAQLTCTRSATVTGLKVGQWVLVTVDVLPDPYTNKRGGTRLMQVIERSEQGLTIALQLMDAGKAVKAAAPTVDAAPVRFESGFTIGVTTTANYTVNVEVATTAIGAARPTDASTTWQPVYSTRAVNSTYQKHWMGAAAGFRHHVRVRVTSDDTVFASDWVSGGYLDIAAANAPSGLTAVSTTPTSATVAWTNNNTTSYIEVRVQPANGNDATYAYLSPGTTSALITPLSSATAANPHTISVRYTDGIGGVGTAATMQLTISPSADTCPPLKAFYVNKTTL